MPEEIFDVMFTGSEDEQWEKYIQENPPGEVDFSWIEEEEIEEADQG